jgi:plasmid stabilization system protein ParE
MARDIVWTAGAERDLLALHRILFDVGGADDKFIYRLLEMPLRSALELIREHPQIAPRVSGSPRLRRRILSPQNRYGLFYAVENRGIVIHALLDLRQDPRMIRKRLGEM